MFIININRCITTKSINILFPNPGDSMEFAGTSSHFMKPGDIVYRNINSSGPIAGSLNFLIA